MKKESFDNLKKKAFGKRQILSDGILILTACANTRPFPVPGPETGMNQKDPSSGTNSGFSFQNGLVDDSIHFSLYLPHDYDPARSYPLYVHLPGYGGEYFQGVGKNPEEGFPEAALKMNPEIIVVSAQLNGWAEQSADDTIALPETIRQMYSVDPYRIWLQGYLGGGETGSLVVDKRPDLFSGFLSVSSKWDGGFSNGTRYGLPFYLAIADNDSYYGSAPFKEAYQKLFRAYLDVGWTEEEAGDLLMLDVRDASWPESVGYQDPHAAGNAFSDDQNVMNWILKTEKNPDDFFTYHMMKSPS